MDQQQARTNMIKQQLRATDVLDTRVLEVIDRTPRELFVPASYQALAYSDRQIPLGQGQVMMAPEMEGAMLQALDIDSADRILEVGTGSGYVTALLARLGNEVTSVEIIPEFSKAAGERLKSLGIHNVNLVVGNGASGWEQGGPYDVIVITGALPFLPNDFKRNLYDSGRLFAILGHSPAKEVMLIHRTDKMAWTYEKMFESDIPELIDAKQSAPFEL